VRAESAATAALLAEVGRGWVAFELRPPRAGEKAALRGHYLDRDWPAGCGPLRGPIFVSPLAVRWEPSGQVVPLFDGSEHGCNPEWGLGGCVHERPAGPQVEWAFPGDAEEVAYLACFAYSFEELSGEEAQRPQDFFETFLLAAWGRKDGRVRYITEFECA
jgi:hypothetical protein